MTTYSSNPVKPFMPPSQITIFICFTYLVSKHFLGDFILQNSYQLINKARYGHPGGLLHAGIHGALSAPLFFLLPDTQLSFFALLIVGEMIVHYHIDWGKEQLLHRMGWSPSDKWFWRVFGFDQLLHVLGYLVMVALLVSL